MTRLSPSRAPAAHLPTPGGGAPRAAVGLPEAIGWTLLVAVMAAWMVRAVVGTETIDHDEPALTGGRE